MKSLRRAAARFREAGSMSLPGALWILSVLLLLAMSAPLAAGGGERSRPSDSSDAGRTAVPRSEGGGGSTPSYSPPPPSSAGPGSSSGSGSEPRVAVPRPGSGDDSASRQRPRGGSDRDFRGHGGGHGSGWYGGYGYGHHYPSWYYYGPYWGWGGWWWDDWFWYGRAPYYYPYRDRGYDRYARYDTAGALDVDVSPGKTEVWIDGRYTGTADDFDGFPQYLWLDKGVYDLVLFRDGYTTIARQITIRPGAVMSIDDRMERGDSVRPEDIATKTHERRDERVESEEERREELSRRDRDRMEDWRDRARRRMEERDRYEDEEEVEDEAEERAEETAEDGASRLRLDVLPDDASVYLDGRFVGTGIDLQRLRNGLRLEPGQHRIAVVRPGHRAEEQEFTVAAGQEVDLDIELEVMK